MALEAGGSLGPYKIVARLGAGGMGEVWRATDTRLHRDVAIKSLPADLARDADRLARFEREAQLLAALSHQNVASIHGLEELGGQPFLVLELVPGEDLAERLKRGALPLDEALDVARQVAEALEAAHERGVVHRDLKPANVKVTPDGKVKVLDFGLAKAWSPDPASGSAPDLSQSPTLARTGTAAGMILGTAAYMSPEQARGKPVDKRSDVWSFGALLHELLTGRPLFTGETVSDVLAAVLTREPDWAALPSETPAKVRALLRRCLERDPKLRLRDIGEARIALASPVEAQAAEREPSAGRTGRLFWPALLAAAALVFAAGRLLRPAPEAAAPAFVTKGTIARQLTFEPGLEAEPDFSPDGNYLAYTTNEHGSLDVAVVPLAGGDVRLVAGSGADEAHPAWSPDGTRIAFTSARDRGGRLSTVNGLSAMSPFVLAQSGDVFLVPAAGGSAVKLVERGAHPAWSPDGRSVAFASDRNGHWDIWTVSAEGGEPRPLMNDPEIDYQPAWSPDGRLVAYAVLLPTLSRARVRVVAADGSGRPRDIEVPGSIAITPAWSPDGRFVYFGASRSLSESRSSLWRATVPAEGRPAQVERLTLGEMVESDPAFARSGTRFAYSRARNAPDLFEADVRSGAVRQLTFAACNEDFPHQSPDGRTLVFSSDRQGTTGLFTVPLQGGAWQPLTSDAESTMARWSPDGASIAFLRSNERDVAIAVQPVGGLQLRTLASMPRSTGGLQGAEWSPDGREVAFTEQTTSPTISSAVRVVSLSGGTRDVVSGLPGLMMFPSWSPDGRELAFQRENDGPRQIWAVSARGGEPREISKGNLRELSHPQWSQRDPDRILVVVDHKNLAVLSVATGRVTPLTRYDDSTRYVDYPSWSRDGTKVFFAMTRTAGDLFLVDNNPSRAED